MPLTFLLNLIVSHLKYSQGSVVWILKPHIKECVRMAEINGGEVMK